MAQINSFKLCRMHYLRTQNSQCFLALILEAKVYRVEILGMLYYPMFTFECVFADFDYVLSASYSMSLVMMREILIVAERLIRPLYKEKILEFVATHIKRLYFPWAGRKNDFISFLIVP